MSIRSRLLGALDGEVVTHPVYAVYDAFLPNPAVDWEMLFSLGLGQINHAFVAEERHPGCEVVERSSLEDGLERRDVTIRTHRGELHEYYLGDSRKGLLPWRMEHFIKTPLDYRLMADALEGSTFSHTDEAFDESEKELGERGITIAHVDRTPFQKVQIDFAGIEAFACHLADGETALLGLLELMNGLKLQEFSCVARSKARVVKLWENIGIDAVGPRAYRQHIVPVYERILAILRAAGKQLLVHYDGKVRLIADDIRLLGLDLDSLTPEPEGDVDAEEARALWPESFLWLHPSLTWFRLPQQELRARFRRMARVPGRGATVSRSARGSRPTGGKRSPPCSRSSGRWARRAELHPGKSLPRDARIASTSICPPSGPTLPLATRAPYPPAATARAVAR